METHYLEKLFNPQSIAVIGASEKPLSIGAEVFNNLISNGFTGTIFPVNPKHQSIQGKPCFASVHDINQSIDLAVIVTPAASVLQVLTDCGEKNIKQAIILSAGFSEIKDGVQLGKEILDLAHHYGIRFIGPNCLGIMRPSIGLNATFGNSPVLPGNLAFVSQSGALVAAILDWAIEEKIGFSALVSLGNGADLEFGDILDFLALDSKTECILLYIEGIRDARRFMSGIRGASRLKPVIAIKAGRHSEGLLAAVSHTGAMVGADDVFDVALRRAGVVRVMSIEELFTAAEVFSCDRRAKGSRLGIVTNGGGAGVMAADRCADLNIQLPELTEKTMSCLNAVVPGYRNHRMPVDILGDATPERYSTVIQACLKDDHCDALLIILIPVAICQPLKVAKLVVELRKKTDKPILVCWMGQKLVKSSMELFARHKIPCFSTPETAIEAFSYLLDYYHNQQLLLQVPEPFSYPNQSDIAGARLIIERVAAEHRKILTTIESKAILRAFGIPITQTLAAKTAMDALIAAESLGFPVVMKINSPDITHKQDVGGVQLNIKNADAVRHVFNELIDNARKKQPDANILGVTVEKMYKTTNDRELMVGVLNDPIFGPVINFGAGGSLVEVMQDRALALPPLNQYLVKHVIARTHIARILGEFRNKPAVNLDAIETVLLRVSNMACELPQIQEMDINPLIVNDKEIMAVDARIVINFSQHSIPYSHMAIHPYPNYLISDWQLADGTPVVIRPIRPEDATLEQDFVRHLSAQTKHFRFMGAIRELTPEMLKRTTQIDYDREMAILAITQDTLIGIARYVINPDLQSCEFGLVVADSWQNKGVGYHLMTCLIVAAKIKHLKVMEGRILSANSDMLTLARNLGFEIRTEDEDPTMKTVSLTLI